MRKSFVGVILVAILTSGASAVAASDGDLDSTWSGDGLVEIAGWDDNWVEAVSPYGVDKVLVAGYADSGSGSWDISFIARFDDNGDLDPTCNTTGVATYSDPNGFITTDMAVLADGSIVIVGFDLSGNTSGVVLKFDSSCRLDSTFGSGGVFTFNERDGVTYQTVSATTDNKLLIGGATYFAPADGGDSRFTVHRIDATTGTFDVSFGDGNGRFVSTIAHEGSVTDLVLAPDGSVVFTGIGDAGDDDLVVAKLTANGIVDTTFATSGWYERSTTDDERGLALVRRTDGRLVVLEQVIDTTSALPGSAIVCLTATGLADTACGGTGRVSLDGTLGASNQLFAMSIDNHGRLLASGSIDVVSSGSFLPVIVRLTANGLPDGTFGTGGVVTLAFDQAHAFSVGVDRSGRVLTGGVDYGTPTTGWIARLASSNPPPATVDPTLLPATGSDGRPTIALIVVAMGVLLLVARRPRVHSAQ